jgi:hypothetical protein
MPINFGLSFLKVLLTAEAQRRKDEGGRMKDEVKTNRLLSSFILSPLRLCGELSVPYIQLDIG